MSDAVLEKLVEEVVALRRRVAHLETLENPSVPKDAIIGMIVPFSGNLGGTNNHYPIDPTTGQPDTRWHICNGETVNGVQTPDLRDRFIVGAGGSYGAGAAGGAASHAHTYTQVPSHSHAVGTLAVGSAGAHEHSVSTVDSPIWDGAYTAFQYGKGNSPSSHPTGSAGDHTHSLSGSTASAGVSSPSTASASSLPPYVALVWLMRVA